MEELREKIGKFLMRKTKEECLSSLPVLVRTELNVEIPKEIMKEYEAMIEGMRSSSSSVRYLRLLRYIFMTTMNDTQVYSIYLYVIQIVLYVLFTHNIIILMN